MFVLTYVEYSVHTYVYFLLLCSVDTVHNVSPCVQTVKTTLENALKSGDPTLVDDLKESQRKTLSIMGQNDKKARYVLYTHTYIVCTHTRTHTRTHTLHMHTCLSLLRELLAQCLKSKIGLTENIHGRLQ